MDQNDLQQIVQTLKYQSTLEILYYISNLFLAVFAGIGLYQLKLLKNDSKVRSTRESIQVSIQQIESFTDKLLPLLDGIEDALKSKNIERYKGKVLRRRSDIKRNQLDLFKALHDDPKLINDYNKMINTTELFAFYFILRLGDERIAYNSVGLFYLEIVRMISPLIATEIESDNTGKYKEIYELYDLWLNRSEKAKNSAQLEKLKIVISNIKDESLKPIGT